MGYQPKTYRKDGGDTLVIASGGSLDVNQGASIKDSTKGISGDRVKIVKTLGALSAVSGAGKVLSWQGPTGTDVLVTRLVLRITTASTQAGCIIDAGTATASVTTSSDNLIDGLVATGTAAVECKDNIKHGGTNGRPTQFLKAGKWITVTATGTAVTALAGSAYVEYIAV